MTKMKGARNYKNFSRTTPGPLWSAWQDSPGRGVAKCPGAGDNHRIALAAVRCGDPGSGAAEHRGG